MRRALYALIWLYPKKWRNRYENEFLGLIEEIPPTWRTFFNVFGGALKMQMKTWSPWKIVAAFAALGLLGAVAFSFTIPDRYLSTAIIGIEYGGLEGVSPTIQRMESSSALTRLINEQGLYERERAHVPIEDVIEQMKKDIRVTIVKSTKGLPAVAISFTSGDAAKAQRTAQGLVGQFIDASLHAHDDDRTTVHTYALYDPPSLPVCVGPLRSRIMITGAVAGLLAGVLFSLFNGLKIWKHAVILGAAGAVLMGAASYLAPERYSSKAWLAYRPADEGRVQETIGAVMSNANLHALVSKFGLSREKEIRDHLYVQQIQKANAIMIQFDYADQRIVHSVTQYVVAQFIRQDWNLEILDPASFPQTPFFPNRSMAASVGLALGLAVATVLGIKGRRLEVKDFMAADERG
jgi:capsular polysaccharide biosynthesis protein